MKIRREIYGMARIGWVPYGSEKTVEVYVNTDDAGQIPHFHVRKYGRRHRFDWEVCVVYESCNYFTHGRYRGTIPDRNIIKQLDTMLRQQNPIRPGRTFWQTAIEDWNANNSERMLPYNLVQPDYTKLSTR